jgi:hypothetical protein
MKRVCASLAASLCVILAGLIAWRAPRPHVPTAATVAQKRICPGDIGCPGNPGSVRLVVTSVRCSPNIRASSLERYSQSCVELLTEQFRGATFEHPSAK